MTHEEALEERAKISTIVKNWKALDPWHVSVIGRYNDLGSYVFCTNCRDKDPGPWEMPPIPEGVEP